MARPNKSNAEYFTHDSDMRNDVKIKALRRRYEHKGYAVWCFLLEILTDSPEFEITFGDIDKELLAADFDITVEELTEIVEYCVRLNLLVRTAEGKLYSRNHKSRFKSLIARRERERKKEVIVTDNPEKQGLSIPITDFETVSDTDNQYSRVEESKEEESREKKSRVSIPYAKVVELWNSICTDYPKVVKLTDARRQKIKSRLAEFNTDPSLWLQAVEDLFRRVQASKFLRGDNNHSWQATFDWLFDNGSNWVKVQEGNYDNKGGYRPVQPAQQRQTTPAGVTLGIGEYIDPTGRRTYGTGSATIPMNAPARPSDRHAWNSSTNQWTIL